MHLRGSVCAAFAGALLVLGPGSTEVQAQAECQRLYSSCQDYCHYGMGPSFGGSDCKQECRDQLKACRYAGSGYPVPPRISHSGRRSYYGPAPVAPVPAAGATDDEKGAAPTRATAPVVPAYGGWGYGAPYYGVPYYGGYRPPVYGYPAPVYGGASDGDSEPAYELPE